MNDQPQFDVGVLRADMNLNFHEVDQRTAWLGLTDDDVKLLGEMDLFVDPHIGAIVDALTTELTIDGESRFQGDEQSRYALRQYFGGLTSGGRIDDVFVDRRLTLINALREQVRPDMSWHLASYRFYMEAVARCLSETTGDVGDVRAMYGALRKVVFLDLSLAIDSYVFERDRTIRSQQRELEELSTPVLQLRTGLLILPIIGMLDSRRAQQLTEQLLQAIRTRRGKVVVLDVTGVAAVDSRVANHLIQTVDAARLMGATAIVTGVSPEVAQSLVGLGIGLGNVTTVADLEGGIEEADRLLGLQVVRVDGGRHSTGRS